MNARNVLPAILIVAALAGAALLYAGLERRAAQPLAATVLPEARALPAVELVDSAGQPFTPASLRGDWTLVFFGFANCPDICPITLQQLAAARRELGADADAAPPQILFVGVDARRDTPEVLASFIRPFGPGVRAVTGSPAELQALASGLGLYFRVHDDGSETYNVEHSSAVLLLNPDGKLQAIFSAPHSVADLAADLSVIMSAS